MNLLAILISALAIFAAGGAASYKATSLYYEHEIDTAKSKAQKAVDDANQKAINAADDYEVWASLQRPRTITITREVEREVKADSDCSARALPDGLRDTLTAAAAADTDQPRADGAVPPAPGASAGDVGRFGPRLRGLFGRTEGLPSTTQSTD